MPSGITEKQYLEGNISILRNPRIVNVFYHLQIIEKFGTGVRRIKSEYEEYDDEPIFQVTESSVSIILPKIQYKKESDIVRTLIPEAFDSESLDVLLAIKENPETTLRELEKRLKISKSKILRIINNLVEQDVLEKVGTTRNRHYIILVDFKE